MERRRRRKPVLNRSMPNPDISSSLEGIEIIERSLNFKKDIISMKGSVTEPPLEACEFCGGDIYYSHRRQRSVVDLPVKNKPTEITLEIEVFKCNDCGKCHSPIPSGIEANKRLTRRARDFVVQSSGYTNVMIAKSLGISEKSVRNIKKEFCGRPF